jgi:hypothetical protein
MAKDKDKEGPTGFCPRCGKNLALVGVAHNCGAGLSTIDERIADEKRLAKKLPPMEHPEDEPIVGAQIDDEAPDHDRTDVGTITYAKPTVPELQAAADAVPADKPKKRGRPAKHTPEERKALRAELMRKKRAEAAKK